MKVAIDLLWVRHGISGGTESVIRNLMHGFGQYANDIEFVLLVAKDNADTFKEYQEYQNMRFEVCNTESASRWKRTIWQRLHIKKLMETIDADVYFSPIYSTPGKLRIPTVAVIHDLQALHFPEYFSLLRNKYMYWSWNSTCKNADIVVTISNFCRNDIVEHLKIAEDKVRVIYNPIIPSDGSVDFDALGEKYSISKGQYFYTVSSLAKHKNLITLLKGYKLLFENGCDAKLVITGIKVNAANEIVDFVKQNQMEKCVVFTGFISNEERDALYKACKAFVYPSIFEGFGMPPIEAMLAGAPVITTRETSIEEVTEGLCIYVDNAKDEIEWFEKMSVEYTFNKNKSEIGIMEKYGLKKISGEYCRCFQEL